MHLFESPQLIGFQPKCLAFDLWNSLNSSSGNSGQWPVAIGQTGDIGVSNWPLTTGH
jgi:hypothetical protein